MQDFRDKNPKITAKWKEHDRNLKQCAAEGWDFTIDIPSGRTLKYFRCRNESDGVTVATQKGALRRVKMYGANLFQEHCARVARDCFAHILTNLDKAGKKVVLHVHDEVVVEVDEADALHAKADVMTYGAGSLMDERCPIGFRSNNNQGVFEMIIGLTGFKGCGKSTVAEIMRENYGYSRHSFAQPIKDMLEAMGLTKEELYNPKLKEIVIPEFGKSPREIMQLLGTEFGRSMIKARYG